MSGWIAAGQISGFQEGRPVALDLAGRRIAIVQVQDGTFHAFDALCPHKGGPLEMGFVEDRTIYCPLHGWAFDIATGQCKESPEKPIQTYPTRQSGTQIEILMP